ncbi:hypothetical protein DB30_07268 [Enhygromyxa salina]|uniref:Uncharacterized protein n=1 Tax=Enhygromyxa salina TaxID=215803 RepID=A0A0C2CSC3_9BACT|nr:hypothetical protein [Enhygromyxa salina]KIG14081.1 hypothetical protein DB30_07268 [Enhygromyxa salina]
MAADPDPAASSVVRARVGRARGFVVGLAALLILIDLLLGAVAGPLGPDTLDNADDVRRYLRATAQAEGAPWLLIGDSVVVGDTGQAELASWHEHRLVDYLDAELAEHEDAVFRQVAFSGMLPVDMLAVIEALDREDPDARVSLLVELSPRHFSGAYAHDETPSRPWFAELTDGEDAGVLGIPSMDEVLGIIRRWTPIYRHRDRFADTRDQLLAPAQGSAEQVAERGNRVEALARLSVHYLDPQLGPESVQVAALREIARRCRASGRRLAMFTVPLEDGFIGGIGRASTQGDYVAQLDAMLEPDGKNVALLPMDHPQFRSELFWDHVHLRPEGHRALAINLLHQLGLRLANLPRTEELIGPWGFDASLVARLDVGSSNGAAWQALFASPHGVAVSSDDQDGQHDQHIVIADTGNHVLRQLHGDLRVVSTFAGTPGVAGDRDGPPSSALLDRPRSPLLVGDSVYFTDGEGSRLRRVAAGEVQTVLRTSAGWQIQALRAHQGRIYMLQARAAQTRILAVEPDFAATTRVIRGEAPGLQITAFTINAAGELYLATANGQLHTAKASARELDLAAPDPQQLRLVFENVGGEVLPQNDKHTFPRAYADIRLSEIVGLEYVERYGGLLVQDLAPHEPGTYEQHVTERAHLRFLDLEREVIYPWLKPLTVGLGYFYFNQSTQGFSSYFHEGSMAIDQRTATLVYLEDGRSRLLRLEDGLLGVAKIGQFSMDRLGFRDLLGARTGERAMSDHDPTRFLDDASATDPARRGPYVWLLMGSSMMSMSELVGQYSLGRQLARRIERDLALREGIELHTFQRTIPGGRLTRQITAIKGFMQVGRPDIISIEANTSTFLPDDADDAFMAEQLERLTKLARRWDSKLVIIDTSPYIVRNRESLRPTSDQVARFLELARERGFVVIDVGDAVLDRHIEVAPFASPPVSGIHPPPWAIDTIADEVAAALSPVVRDWLRARAPALRSEGPESVDSARTEPLGAAFQAHEFGWADHFARLPAEATQVDYDGDHLLVFVDLAQVSPGLAEALASDERLDELVLAVVYEQTVRLHNGARTADIVLARFGHYDEYGAGVNEGATIVRREHLTHETLGDALQVFIERR